MLQNFIANPPTFRPRLIDCPAFFTLDFFRGTAGNTQFTPDLITTPVIPTRIVTNIYAAYSAQIDFLPNYRAGCAASFLLPTSQAEWKFRPMS